MSSTIPNSTVPAGSTEAWKDKKRYLWLIGLVVPSLAFIAFGGYALTGWGAWLWLGPVVILGIVPAIDLIAGLDRSNPPDDAIEALENDKYYRWITYLFLPIQYAGFVGAFYLIGGGTPFDIEPLGVIDKIGLAISIGAIGGIGINTAHELGHKSEKIEQWLAKVALAQSLYGHFYVEHNFGHHVRVATPQDPASSRFGESFWRFLPRSAFGGLRSAWRIESARLQRKGKRTWSFENNILNAWAMSVVLFATLIGIFGWEVAPWLLLQAVAGFTFLEAANYLEHYGLLRGKRADGSYVRASPADSWNSDHVVSNLFLYQLQRHSDHHANPKLRYQSLRSAAEAPQLPAGYAVMIVIAWIPPLWRRVMDQRLLDYYDGDTERINVG